MKTLHRWLFAALLAVPGLALADVALPPLADAPTSVRPLLLGSPVPAVDVTRLDGTSVPLRELVGSQRSVIVFYRGGWCPYCNLQLQGLRLIREPLAKLGYRLIAISPDSPASMRATLDKTPLEYTLVSDASSAAIRAFGLAYRLDDATYEKYAGHGIDLEKASGQGHHALPVPAVYLTDGAGTLQFSYVHPDYKVRMPEKVILAAAEALAADEENFARRLKK
ncbi:MAG TPA: peroxiredoxin-like family protein [Tahibacter sp.]|nr:peroxiredoxin-like family protein [Tahibacter sp.]